MSCRCDVTVLQKTGSGKAARSLTEEEQRFAEKHHKLVHAFLKQHGLQESVFYDVVIFGYLRGVQEYCEKSELRRYWFSTIAWKRMQSSLANYLQYLSRPKRSAVAVSLEAPVGAEDGLRWEKITGKTSEEMIAMEIRLLLDEMEKRLPHRTMCVIRRKLAGCRMHDIAKMERLRFRDINRILEQSRGTIIDVLWGTETGKD